MKKFIYSFASLSCISASFGMVFKVLHWAGANEMLIFGLAGISLAIPMLLFKSGLSVFDRTRYWFAILSIAIFAIGTYFKIRHFAGANECLILGMMLFSLGFLPMYFIKRYRESIAS